MVRKVRVPPVRFDSGRPRVARVRARLAHDRGLDVPRFEPEHLLPFARVGQGKDLADHASFYSRRTSGRDVRDGSDGTGRRGGASVDTIM